MTDSVDNEKDYNDNCRSLQRSLSDGNLNFLSFIYAPIQPYKLMRSFQTVCIP